MAGYGKHTRSTAFFGPGIIGCAASSTRTRRLLGEGLGLRQEVGDRQGIASSRTSIAWLDPDEGRLGDDHEHDLEGSRFRWEIADYQGLGEVLEAVPAAQLWGAASPARRETVSPPPAEGSRRERRRTGAREYFGAAGRERALASGHDLASGAAVTLAGALPAAPTVPKEQLTSPPPPPPA